MNNLVLTRPARLDKRTKAFPYQEIAIEAIHNKEYVAIFFEQGLGKTKIAIDITLDWLCSEVVDSVIIVTKKGLIRNWAEEFEIHSHIKPKILTSDRASNHRAFFSPVRVYLANYESIAVEEERIQLFAKHRSLAIILDESQKIKNADSKLTEAFFRLSPAFKKRIIMTGTPIANRPYDIWAQIYFLDHGQALGSEFKEFKQKLDLPKERSDEFIECLSRIMPKISDFALRQTKEGSGLELPGKSYETRYADWEPRQRDMYLKVRNELRLEIIRDGMLVDDASESILKRLLRLVQISSNPKVVDESYNKTPGKFQCLKSIVEEIVAKNEKCIVWTSFVDNCRYLAKNLSGYGTVQIHGRMSVEDRGNSVQKFKNEDKVRILIATPAAAKEGLTLTVANNVIFYDRGFSLDDYIQAQDRIHRISQQKECRIINILLQDSIDEWIGALVSLKSASARYAIGDIANSDELNEALETNLNEVLASILGEANDNVE